MPDKKDFLISDEVSSLSILPHSDQKWKIIIADDEEEVHNLTKMVLEDYTFDNKGVEFISAFSGDETIHLLKKHPDTALLLLDVVMEEENTGLKLVEYIRNNLKNHFVRIILRTGQPGQAPEKKVIREYDINDYKSKIELTSQKLFTAITSALRSYKDLRVIEKNSLGLKQLIHSSHELFEIQSLNEFTAIVLKQLPQALDIFKQASPESFPGFFLKEFEPGNFKVISSTHSDATKDLDFTNSALYQKILPALKQLNKNNTTFFSDNFFIAFFPIPHDQAHYLYCEFPQILDNMQKELLHLFSNNILIALDNVYLVTGLEEARDKAQESYRLKSEFLAVISHEIRTPLTSMLGFSDLLCKNEELSEDNRKMAEMIHQSGKRLLQILTDVLELSVIEAGKQKTNLKAFRIEQLIDDIYILFKTGFNRKNIDFITQNFKDVMLYSDPMKIRQILYNFIGNALKFTEKGSVTLSLKIEEDKYIFEIKDTGIGIHPEHESFIFEMFRQIESPDRRKYGGTGLGLTICKKLVTALGGEIWLNSTPEKGTSFYFSLPRDPAYEQKSQKEYQHLYSESINKKKTKLIYLAEDENSNAQLIKSLLEKKTSYKVEIFQNGKELLQNFGKEEKQVDLIILDIQMPVLDGKDTLKLLRESGVTLPIIALTAYSTELDKKEFIDFGFDDYIVKPIEQDHFINAISRFLLDEL